MSWFSELFSGGKNPADKAMPYLDQIPGQTNPYMQPFFEAGKNALDPLQEQYTKLLSDPGALMNKMGESYKQSPGFKFALEQALGAGANAAAAGGMAGTPMNQFNQMETATGLTSQDFNNWLTHILDLYGKGLSGEEGMAGRGQEAGKNIADMIAQTLAQKGNLAFQGQAQKNENKMGLMGGIAKGIGSLAAFNPWHAFGNI